METGVSLKKQGVVTRMVEHPVGALLGGVATAIVCGVLGMIHGEIVAVVMAVLGVVVGAPLGAMTAASAHNEA
jgi:ABC-type enterobactin transport system permease subunit